MKKENFTLPKTNLAKNFFSEFCLTKLGVHPTTIRNSLNQWLMEDSGSGDVTVFSAQLGCKISEFFIIAKQNFTLCGLDLMAEIFNLTCDKEVELYSDFKDGMKIKNGDIVLAGKGLAAGILLAERSALNIGSKLSGISTITNSILEKLNAIDTELKPTLLETRKTTPGLRIFEKYATRTGGAKNHRHGLDSGAMLKENHLRCIGGISTSLQRLKAEVPILTKVEVEVTNLEEFDVALNEGADVIMLDNFSVADVTHAVKIRNAFNKQIKLEVSGNLLHADLTKIAATGVDYASMGGLIHQAVWVDMSLQLF